MNAANTVNEQQERLAHPMKAPLMKKMALLMKVMAPVMKVVLVVLVCAVRLLLVKLGLSGQRAS